MIRLTRYLLHCLRTKREPDYRHVAAITGVPAYRSEPLVRAAYVEIARRQVSDWRHERKSDETRRRIGAGVRRARWEREVGVLEFEEGRAA